jgi:C4-dicarboxylate transporter, DctM subunit
MNDPTLIGIAGVILLLVLFFLEFEIGFALAFVGFFGFAYLVSFEAAATMLVNDIYKSFFNYGLTVVPLFVLMGQIMTNAGVSTKLFRSADKFVGHIPGGLGIATVGAATLFKAICGSSIATSATFAGVAIPEMDKHHYSKSLSTGIVATVGTLGILLPPSIVLIILGLTIQESIGRLFLAGIVPGLMVAVSYVLIIYTQCKLKPDYGPRGKKSSWKERIMSLSDVIAVLAIFVIVMGGIFGGIFTPSEAGAVGTVCVFIYAVAREGLGLQGMKKAISDTLGTTCMVVLLIAGAMIFGRFFAATKISFQLANWIGTIPVNRNIIVLIIALIYLIGGSFIEDMAFLIMATPIFYPVIVKLGFDPTWFVIFICVVLMIGVVIPPMAMNVFVVSNLAKVPTGTVYKGVYPLLIGLTVVGALIMIFPQIPLILPKMFGG